MTSDFLSVATVRTIQYTFGAKQCNSGKLECYPWQVGRRWLSTILQAHDDWYFWWVHGTLTFDIVQSHRHSYCMYVYGKVPLCILLLAVQYLSFQWSDFSSEKQYTWTLLLYWLLCAMDLSIYRVKYKCLPFGISSGGGFTLSLMWVC